MGRILWGRWHSNSSPAMRAAGVLRFMRSIPGNQMSFPVRCIEGSLQLAGSYWLLLCDDDLKLNASGTGEWRSHEPA